MTLEVEFTWLAGLLVTFLGAMAGLGKLMLSQMQKHLDTRFKAQEEARASNHSQTQHRLDRLERAAQDWSEIERNWLKWQAEMPLQYVRREDYIRGQSVIESKLDALASKLETAQLRIAHVDR